jgi:hypothetical protein
MVSDGDGNFQSKIMMRISKIRYLPEMADHKYRYMCGGVGSRCLPSNTMVLEVGNKETTRGGYHYSTIGGFLLNPDAPNSSHQRMQEAALQPPLGKQDPEHYLFYFLHFSATCAFTRFLAYRAAGAPFSAGTGILGFGHEIHVFAINRHNSLIALN